MRPERFISSRVLPKADTALRERLECLMQDVGFTYADLARELTVSRPTVTNWFKGSRGCPPALDVVTAIQIANLMGLRAHIELRPKKEWAPA